MLPVDLLRLSSAYTLRSSEFIAHTTLDKICARGYSLSRHGEAVNSTLTSHDSAKFNSICAGEYSLSNVENNQIQHSNHMIQSLQTAFVQMDKVSLHIEVQ